MKPQSRSTALYRQGGEHGRATPSEPHRQARARLGRIASLAVTLYVFAHVLSLHASQPTFENRTPVGFSSSDSTKQTDFVEGDQITVRVDLNQAATPTYPVIGHFHNLERSEILETTDVDGLRSDISVSDDGVIHVAWITQEVVSPVTTPAYHVEYARSHDGGESFTTPVSVSGTLRFDILTVNGGGPSFSTLDLELDSRGNPRVVYAFNHSADGNTAKFSGNHDNVYFNHSENGGASWQPSNNAIVTNDTITDGNAEGKSTAFPRMVIDQRDNIFITYQRGASANADDIMLAKVDQSSTPFTMEEIGPSGNIGSTGGVRITQGVPVQTGPDIAIGTGDVLHITYLNVAGATIEHKTLLADLWNIVSVSGWDNTSLGATIDNFDPTPAGNSVLDATATFYFPTVVVDTVTAPDRVYAFYKWGDSTPFETVRFNSYIYDHAIGASAGWNTATASNVWSTATSPVFANADAEVELDWTVAERVGAVIDNRRPDRADVHIVFTGGHSNVPSAEHDIYYGFYNGVSWTLPEKVADDDSDTGTEDGILTTDVFLSAPAISKRPGDDNVYMVFGGGTAEGLGVEDVTDVNHHPYFKVLGRAVTSQDQSVPTGGYQYDLSYTPVNPHDATSTIEDNPVYVHVADNVTGDGIGATGKQSDGFLAGDWENVGTSLQDNDKFFEGRFNEDTANDHEWGDDDDKIDLLVKLNVLGSDSSTNLQLVTNSTASDGGTAQGARTVRVGSTPPVSVAIGDFFLLGVALHAQ